MTPRYSRWSDSRFFCPLLVLLSWCDGLYLSLLKVFPSSLFPLLLHTSCFKYYYLNKTTLVLNITVTCPSGQCWLCKSNPSETREGVVEEVELPFPLCWITSVHRQESIRDSNPCSAAAHSAPSNQSYKPSEGAMDNIQGESPGVVTNECVRRILRAKARATLGWGGGGIETGGLPSCGKCPACFLHLPMDSYRVLKGLQMNREEESAELRVSEERSSCQALYLGSTQGEECCVHTVLHTRQISIWQRSLPKAAEPEKVEPSGGCASSRSRAKFPELFCSKGMKRERAKVWTSKEM